MEEYKIGNATVRIRGSVDQERLERATNKFLKHVVANRRRNGENGNVRREMDKNNH